MIRSELLNEVINVIGDVLCSFLVVEVSYPFLHNHFLQIWHIPLETTTLDILLHP